jgi:hypothetical protein
MHPHDTIARERYESVFVGPRLRTPYEIARFHSHEAHRSIRQAEAAVRTLLSVPPAVRAELPTMHLYHVLAQLQEAREEWEDIVGRTLDELEAEEEDPDA